MQLQDYIFYYHSNYLKNYKEIMRAQRARNALVKREEKEEENGDEPSLYILLAPLMAGG